MVRIGIVGIGFMGRIHYLAAQKVRGARVAAVCSRDPAKLAGDWRNTRGNFGPEPGRVDLSGVKTYSNVADLLADPDIDLVDLCTVTDQHAPLAIRALEAGKHVLCEKPLARTPDECRAMIDTAARTGRVLATGHNYRFYPSFELARDVLASGRIGPLSHIRAYAGYSATGHNQPWVKDASVVGGGALHDNGIQVNGSFVLGFDHDRKDVFARTAGWIEENRLECATFHILTPYPATPLFRQMEAEGRLLHRDWALYDTAHAVFRPKNMSPEELEEGYAWMYQRLFSHASIWRRRWR